MTKIKVPVTGMDNSYVEVPAHDHLSKVQASTDYLHGDGFWPIYQDKMAKVEPGNGLTVLINDYFALIDGYKVGYRGIKELNWNQKITLDVSSAVGKDPVYIALKVGRDEKGVKCNKEGIFFLIEQEPNERGVFSLSDGDAIPVARLRIPAGTTQITEDMIDNSVKKWLADIDKAIANLKNYVYCKVEEAKREVFKWILEEFKPEIIDEIARGDEAVKAELNQKISALQSQINDLNVSVDQLRSSFNEFLYYVNKKIENLETISEELQNVLSSATDKLIRLEVDVQKLFEKDDQLTHWISGLENRISQLESTSPQFDQSLASGISMALDELSWTKWILTTYNWSITYGVSKRGFVDVFKDLGWVDLVKSGNIELVFRAGEGVYPLVIPNRAYYYRYFQSFANYVKAGKVPGEQQKTFTENWDWFYTPIYWPFSGLSPNGYWIIRSGYGQSNFGWLSVSYPWCGDSYGGTYVSGYWGYSTVLSNFFVKEGPLSFDWFTGSMINMPYNLNVFWNYIGETAPYYVLRFGVGAQSRIVLAIAQGDYVKEVLYSSTDVYIPVETMFNLTITKIENDDGSDSFKIEGLSSEPIIINVPAEKALRRVGKIGFSLSCSKSTIDNVVVTGFEPVDSEQEDLVSVAYQTDSVPSKVYLAAEYDGNITFYVSRDDGTTWEEVTPYTIHTIGNIPEGQLLRYKATLTKDSRLYAVYLAYI